MNEIAFKKINKDATTPIKGSKGAAGFDLFNSQDVIIKKGRYAIINTKIAIEIPQGYYGYIGSRSGLALEYLITIAGIIDADFRGEILVLLYNLGKKNIKIEKGTRCAQIIISKIHESNKLVLKKNLTSTERSESGFGSSGKKKLKNKQNKITRYFKNKDEKS